VATDTTGAEDSTHRRKPRLLVHGRKNKVRVGNVHGGLTAAPGTRGVSWNASGAKEAKNIEQAERSWRRGSFG